MFATGNLFCDNTLVTKPPITPVATCLRIFLLELFLFPNALFKSADVPHPISAGSNPLLVSILPFIALSKYPLGLGVTS